MNVFKSKNAGFSLIEIMLVLAIAAALIVLSMRQYQTYKLDADLQEVKYNVDMLAQAASRFYYMNCGSQTTTTGNIPGKLHPDSVPANPFGLDISTDLQKTGILTAPVPANRLVTSYLVQLNEVTPYNKTTTTCADPACTTTTSTVIGTVIDWQIQIGVLFKDPTLAQNVYAGYLGSSCVSTLKSNGTTVPCDQVAGYNFNCQLLRFLASVLQGLPICAIFQAQADSNGCPPTNNAASYNNTVVFVRSPSFPILQPQGGTGSAAPLATMFNQPYNTNPITNLTTGTIHLNINISYA